VLLPDPALKRSSAIGLDGEIPGPIGLPAGCSLAGRCPLADTRCRSARPEAIAVTPQHLVRCYHHGKVAAIDQTVDHFAHFQEESKKVLSVGAGCARQSLLRWYLFFLIVMQEHGGCYGEASGQTGACDGQQFGNWR
jgi:oligopeptide/dipeptide ABC transporter ATP-binding protein